ncbi:MAG: PTS sugar transporter subunit IIA [Gemmatimonadetes bacterium]|nr:MAG: PTS sugar transporter subunit IIA [Gemmatimonadota bacterium]
MLLTQLFDVDVIDANLRTRQKKEVFQVLVQRLADTKRIENPQRILEEIEAREIKMNTAISPGVAIPHARTNLVNKLVGSLGISKKGFDYQAKDGNPVHLVFLLVSPLQNVSEHIAAMAQIARLVETPEFYQKLVEASTAEKAFEILQTHEQRLKGR